MLRILLRARSACLYLRLFVAECGFSEMPPSKPFPQLQQQFKDLVVSPINHQLELFLKSFIFDLGDNWKFVVELSK
jgi:hypothetical protein